MASDIKSGAERCFSMSFSSPRAYRSGPRAWQWIAASLVLLSSASALAGAAHFLLPQDESVALGLRLNGRPIAEGSEPRAIAHAEARRLLEQRVGLQLEGKNVLEISLEELGATVDEDALAAHLASIGRRGDWLTRLDEAWLARKGEIDVSIHARVPADELAQKLMRTKEERDTHPRSAKIKLADRSVTPHEPGRWLDLFDASERIEQAAKKGETSAELPVRMIAPRASSEFVATIDTSGLVSKFETRFGFVGNQQGRAQNITRAADGMDGVVLMPGEVISFNDNVGPRSIDNGFTYAPEIYKGEMREGVGGGTCQVASTIHAAAFFGGLSIDERANHSRPSGYIRMGLDATVVYPTVDLRIRNPYEFPIVIHTSIDRGLLSVELRGSAAPVKVDYQTATIGVADYKRKVEEDPSLAAGKIILKQKGIRGHSIKKLRTIVAQNGAVRVEQSTDVYPPTFEIYRVAPGTDIETALPPLPSKDNAQKPAAEPSANQQSLPAAVAVGG